MKNKKNNYKYLTFLISILMISFIIAVPTIVEYATNPADGETTSNSSVLFQYNISSTEGISQIKWNWDGTNYSIYDDSLVLFMNFDNRSALGECENNLTGCVKDLSKYGNNGTLVGNWNSTGHVVSNNISVQTTNCHSGNCFNFSGNRSYIQSLDSSSINITKSFTISLWINPNSLPAGNVILLSKQNSDYYNEKGYGIRFYSTTMFFRVVNITDVDYAEISSTGQTDISKQVEKNKWQNYIFVYNGTAIIIYKNSVYINSTNYSSPIAPTTTSLKIGGDTRNTPFNGSIDDVMIFNRSLSASEISQLYTIQQTKYNSTNWGISINQTLGSPNSTTTSINFPYYICSSNSTNENCTSSKTITQTIPIKNIVVNFTNNLGNVNNNFYGINNHGIYGSINSYIDTNNDGILETLSDYQWHRDAMKNANINIQRIDGRLDCSINTTAFGGSMNWTFVTNANSDYCNMPMYQDSVKWASQNNIQSLIILQSIPSWMANTTTGWCTSGASASCSPLNYSLWGDLALSLIDNLTQNGLYNSSVRIQIMNEPYGGSWLNNLSSDNQKKADEYVKLYNITYWEIKTKYPNMMITFGDHVMNYTTKFTATTLSNLSQQLDFISIHTYPTGTRTLNQEVNWILSQCSLYNANCSKLDVGEFNINDIDGWNFTSNGNQQIASGYLLFLNNYAQNGSIMPYQWSETFKYSNTISYPEYPKRWAITSEPLLDNYLSLFYNTILNIANLCPAGSTVYQSSSDDSTMKTVTCQRGQSYSVILINTDTVSKNVSLSQFPKNNLYNLIDGTLLTSNLGIKDSYDVSYVGNGVYGNNNNIFWNKQSLTISEVKSSYYTKLTNDGSINQNVEFYQLTSALLTNSTSLCNGSTGLMTGNVNITLNPNEFCYVLDEFNYRTDYTRLSSLFGTTKADALYSLYGFTLPVDQPKVDTQDNSILSLSSIIKGFGLLAVAIILIFVIYIVKGSMNNENTSMSFDSDITSLLFKVLIGILLCILVVTVIASIFGT